MRTTALVLAAVVLLCLVWATDGVAPLALAQPATSLAVPPR